MISRKILFGFGTKCIQRRSIIVSHAKRRKCIGNSGKIRDEILLISNRSDLWIQERMAAVRAFAFHSFNDAYFALMDKLPLPQTKLKLLTYQTHEEKTYAVKIVSGLLRSGAEPKAIASDMLVDDYPSLASYMRDKLGQDEAVDEYMYWYRKIKLSIDTKGRVRSR